MGINYALSLCLGIVHHSGNPSTWIHFQIPNTHASGHFTLECITTPTPTPGHLNLLPTGQLRVPSLSPEGRPSGNNRSRTVLHVRGWARPGWFMSTAQGEQYRSCSLWRGTTGGCSLNEMYLNISNRFLNTFSCVY